MRNTGGAASLVVPAAVAAAENARGGPAQARPSSLCVSLRSPDSDLVAMRRPSFLAVTTFASAYEPKAEVIFD
jgi:hypothetical protein